jgi:hypothetical protein
MNVAGRCKEWKFAGAEKTRQECSTTIKTVCKKL